MRDDVITLENERLQVRVMAQHAGRITHLVSRDDDREWLIERRTVPFVASSWGDVYTDSPHCGWDEMLPTVDPCVYPLDPYAGRSMADHGDLWTAPWEVIDQSPTALRQRVHGSGVAFTLERTLALRDNVLRCDYRCDVPVDTAMLWALHPQFLALDGTSLHFQPSPPAVWDTSTGTARTRIWPGDLVVERDVAPGEDAMIYLDPSTTIGSVSLCDRDGSALTMTWDTTTIPYLGVWVDHGRYSEDRVIAIEPTNGFFDDLSRAVRNQRFTWFRANEPASWWVEVAVGTSSGGNS